jgi:hypothetical protein
MSNVDLRFVTQSACNIGVIVGIIALITGSTVLYSMSFTGMIVGFVAGSIYLLQK